MRFTATLALLGLLAAGPTSAQTAGFADVSTGTVNVRVYNNGIIGDNCSETIGFAFNGDNGLCGAGFLWGISASSVIGDAYTPTAAHTGWTPVSAVTPATTSPFPTLPSGVTTSFRNAANNLDVALGAYYNATNPDFVVFHYTITNTGSTDATGYPGLFVDWDVAVAAAASNLAAADVTTSTLYAWDPTGASPNYFGTTIVSEPMTGWRFSTPYPTGAGVPHARADLWQGLTTQAGATATAQDQRFVQGAGPVTIPAGESFEFIAAMAAGAGLTDFQANILDARAAGTTEPPPPPALDDVVLSTGTAALRVFNNGYFGAILGVPTDTTFNFMGGAPSPMFEGQLLVALSPTRIAGQPYATDVANSPTAGNDEWSLGTPLVPITPPAPFTEAYQTTYSDAGNPAPNPEAAGLAVTQRAYARPADDFVVVEVQVGNTTTTPMAGVYIGMFSDFDVTADYESNVGGFDVVTQSVYTRTASATGDQNVYGVTLLAGTASGWNVSTQTLTNAGLYAALTTPGVPATDPDDRRNTIGAGPFVIPAGGSQTVRFAYVAGTDLADFLSNAAAARALFPVSTDDGPSEARTALGAPRPNPAAGVAEMSLTVEQSQSVRVAVYDALGREVAVLHDGAVAAGAEETLRFETAGLPSGVYVVRAVGETFASQRRVTVAR